MKNHLSTIAFGNLAPLSRNAVNCRPEARPRTKCLSRFFWSCLSFGALLLAAPALNADTTFYCPNLFDINIAFGCNCTCYCDTNTVNTNNPVSAFLNANPVEYIYSKATMPDSGQNVPPHYTELLIGTNPNFIYDDPLGIYYTFPPVGWTVTQSSVTVDHNIYGESLSHPVNFNLNYPISDFLNYFFYADKLLKNDPGSSVAGQTPIQDQDKFQPYPWDVNVRLQLHNNQFYYMEQQLVVGYHPLYNSQTIYPPVDYVETNSLITISLYCTNGGVTTILPVSSVIITATLLPINIPDPLNLNVGWVFTPDFYTNWAWPLTIYDTVDPNSPPGSGPRGSAGTVQASLNLGAGTIDHLNLLVRADRAYELTLTYFINGWKIETLTNYNTGVMPACTNVEFSFYTDICTNPFVDPHLPPTVCLATNVGLVDMMGAPNVWPVLPPNPLDSGITMWATDGNNFSTNLTGAALSGLPGTPVPFTLPVFWVNQPSADFEKWATESLGLNTSYEYFRSPSVYPVTEQCSSTFDLTDDFVMCPTNPAIVEGTLSLNGCVNSNYYGGVGAFSFLQFAVYTNDLPYDPAGLPTAGIADPKLQFVSSIQATNGASAYSPFDTGHGFAITEFDNLGAFGSPNDYSGHYALKLAGLQSLPSIWDVNDLHLVFGAPVNLDYHVILTDSPYTNVNISCGAIVTNDIKLCFGLVSLQVVNAYPNHPIPDELIYTHANVRVSGTGPGYVVSPLDFNNYPFDHTSPFQNDVKIPLFLPQGSYQYVTTVSTAGGLNANGYYVPSQNLILGTNYFTVDCCTNSCLQVVCPTNKTVSCATNWSFDLPTVNPGCCDTNYSINVFGNDVASSTGPCSTAITRTWLITDCSGQSNFCSQTVTISPPTSYSITLPAGTTELIANQLDDGNGNLISSLLASLPNKSTVSKWNCSTLVQSTKNLGAWSADYTLAPGEGAFVKSPSTVTVTFTGTPLCPPPTNSLCPCGTDSLLSYGLDCPGTYEDITGLQPKEGSTVRRWNGSGYTINTYTGGAWTLGAPVLNVGEAAFFLIPCPTNPASPVIVGTTAGNTGLINFPVGTGGTFTYNNNVWTVGDYNYVLQSTTNLASPIWVTICNAVPVLGYSLTNAAPVSFYRLQVQTNH